MSVVKVMYKGSGAVQMLDQGRKGNVTSIGDAKPLAEQRSGLDRRNVQRSTPERRTMAIGSSQHYRAPFGAAARRSFLRH